MQSEQAKLLLSDKKMILFNKLLHGKKYLIFAVYAVLKNISDQKNGIWVFACSVNIAFTYFLFFIFLNQIGEQHLLETFFSIH